MDKAEAENAAKELVRILNKILQGYKIRVKTMNRRRELIKLLLARLHGFNAGVVQLNENEILEFKNLLNYDKILVRIIGKEERKGENQLMYAIRVIRSHHHVIFNNRGDKQFKRELKKYGFTIGQLEKMLGGAIEFLEELLNGSEIIIQRMGIEEKFIENPNQFFSDLSGAVRDEVNLDKILLGHLKKLFEHEIKQIRRNKFVRKSLQNPPPLGLASAMLAGASIFMTIRGDIGGTAKTPIFCVLIFLTFAYYMKKQLENILNEEIETYDVEERVVASKRQYWKKK